MARPGFVHEVDERTPPLTVWQGDALRTERLPLGTSVVYPPEPLVPVPDLREAISTALAAPRESPPLRALLRPGMRLVIAFDDLSTPVPPMRAPDVRSWIVEGVLSAAAEAGVDDVSLICARGLRRRLTDAELHRTLGERVFRSFFADGRLTQHDAEDGPELVPVTPAGGEILIELNRRAAESDLLVSVQVVTDPRAGGLGSLIAGLGSTATVRAAGRTEPVLDSSELSVFAVEAVLDSRPPGGVLELTGKREWEWNIADRAAWAGLQHGLPQAPAKARRRLLNAPRTPHRVIAVTAGAAQAVAQASRERVLAQCAVEVDNPVDVGLIGVPAATPYSVDSVTNPILAAWQGLVAILGSHTGRPLVRPGGAVVLYHPLRREFAPLHHPSYVDFYTDVLDAGTDPPRLAETFEPTFAGDAWYRHLYQTSHAFHGVHPFGLWSAVAAARASYADVVWVGADRAVCDRLGFRAASTLADALEIVASTVGRSPRVGYLHPPSAVVDLR